MDDTCEYVLRWEGGEVAAWCGKPATWRYPAMGGGHMHLCDIHAEPHRKYAEQIGMEHSKK